MKKLLKNLNLWPDNTDIKALLISFTIINITYLYNTLNFLWGNHDVVYVKDRLYLNSGIFEGRFTQFIPYILLTNAQILPIINNLLSFIFLTLALWILAKYWEIPRSNLNYTIFITFFATLPYMLSWLYFTFIELSCMLWVLCVISGLHLSEKIKKAKHPYLLSLFATICFYLPLGGYPPIINTIFVCFAAKITLAYIIKKETLKKLYQTYRYTLINIIIAALLTKLTLYFIHPDNVYNLELTPLKDMPQKFISTLKISTEQFLISLPYLEKGYKITLLIMVLIAFIATSLKKNGIKNKIISLIFICTTIWCAALTTFLVIPHTEHVARIDFYGLGFIYAFAAALWLSFKTPILRSLGLILLTFIIFLSIKNDYRAQKNWQQGFTAEMEILDRMVEQIEDHPEFNPNKSYRFYQIGDISLRPVYYRGTFEKSEPFLRDLPYLAMWQGGHLIEFYSPFTYINHQETIFTSDITQEVTDFILNKAEPWPSPNSVYLNQSIILVIYNQAGLDDFKQKLLQLHRF